MRKNTKFKDRILVLATILFFLFCISSATYSIKLFYESINASLTKMNEQPIATVTYKNKMAQRKFEERVIWDRLAQHSPVYNGDTIRTASESTATISFIDGNVMELGENTMAQIFFHDGMAQTSVQGGDVVVNSADAANGAVISFGDSRLELDAGASVGTSFSENGGSVVSVMEGGAVFNNADGTAKTLEEGGGLALDANNGELNLPLITVMNPKPNQNVLNFSGASQNVNFKWNVQNNSENEPLVLEIASDKKFENIIKKEELGNSTETNVSLQNGIYYWRIYLSKTGSSYSAQSKIKVAESPVPNLIIPENGAGYSYRNTPPDVRFSWTQNDYISAFDFEIANNPGMVNPVIKQRMTTPSSTISTLGEGDWYWRVTPYYTINNMGLGEPSEVRKFSITKTDGIKAAELIFPNSGEVINTIQKETLSFSWKNNSEVAEYEIKIAKDAGFNNAVVAQRVKSNVFTVSAAQNNMQNGSWYWRVTQYDTQGNFFGESEVRQFSTEQNEFEQRMVYPPEGFELAAANVGELRFTWKTNVAGDTVFQIAKDRNFQNLVVSQVENGQSFQGANLADGTYYWRIASQSFPERVSEARGLSVLGKIEDSNLEEKKEEDSVQKAIKLLLAYPANGATIDGVQAMESRAVVRWSSEQRAQNSVFTLSRSSDGRSNPIVSMQNPSTEIRLPSLEPGTYYWTVRAQNEFGDDISAAAPRSFIVQTPQYGKIALLFPVNGERVKSADSNERTIFARWSFEQSVLNSTFTISRSSDGYSNPVFSEENPSREVPLPRLEPGTYYWTVSAKNERGYDISAAASWFTVEAPKFENILLAYPANGATIDGIEAIERPGVVRWSSTQRAVNSTFTLSRSSNGYSNPIVTEENPSTEIRLPKLEPGTYYWTVRAKNEQGYDISAVPSRFTVLTPRFKNIQLTYPANGATIDGVAAMETPNVARWTCEEKAVNPTFTLSRSSNGYTNPIVTIENPAAEIQLPRLEPGTYYWTVRAKNEHGYDISAAARNFTVSALNLLDRTALGSPADRTVYGVKEIRISKEIDFEWSEVKDATAYLFILKNSSGDVLINRTLSRPNFKLPDMGLLGAGEFTWSVQAVQNLGDGTFVRGGEPSTNSFKIDLPETQDVIIDDAGILYGL